MESPNFKDPHIFISGVPYPVRFGYLSFSIFNEAGYVLQDTRTATVLLRLYHAGILAGCRRNKVPAISWEDFETCLDDDDNAGVFDAIKEIYESESVPKK
jgi:hypothetical protein